jgi:hypothetical protein
MSGYIGPAPVPQATQTRQTFTATSGQTSFATIGYVAGGQFIQVYLNGVLLKLTDDYTAANGSDIVLTSGAATGDVLEFITFADFTVNNQNFTGGLTVDNDGSTVLTVDRATSDGTIIDLQKSGSSVGSIGTNSGRFAVYGTDRGIRFTASELMPTNGSGTATDDILSVGHPSYRFKDLHLSGGVYLGGTGSANKLDDYEEGTWTPAFNQYSGAYVLQGGHYTKIGRTVTISGTVYGNSGTNGSGQFYVTGLPFASESSGPTDYHPVFVNIERGAINISNLDYMSMIPPSSTQIWFFRDNGNTGGMTTLNWVTHLDSNSRFRFNFSYNTSA